MSEYTPQKTPPFEVRLVKTPDGCTYGGQASIQVYFGGRYVLRVEHVSVEEAERYLERVEWIGPRLGHPLSQRKEWQVVWFHEGGFTTLELQPWPNCPDKPAVYYYQEMEVKHQETLPQRLRNVLSKANHAASWHERRGRYKAARKYVKLCEVIKSLLNGEEPEVHGELLIERGNAQFFRKVEMIKPAELSTGN